jgi:hypothetical protein
LDSDFLVGLVYGWGLFDWFTLWFIVCYWFLVSCYLIGLHFGLRLDIVGGGLFGFIPLYVGGGIVWSWYFGLFVSPMPSTPTKKGALAPLSFCWRQQYALLSVLLSFYYFTSLFLLNICIPLLILFDLVSW